MRSGFIAVVMILLAIESLDFGPKVRAQSATLPPSAGVPQNRDVLAFDVASIKENKSGRAVKAGMGFQPGRLTAGNYTLRELITSAFGRDSIGGPKWIDSDRFDIEAKGNFTLAGFLPGADGSPPRAYVMLQTLLTDRFTLVLHTEQRQVPAYALIRLKPTGPLGPKLRASDIDCDAIMAAIVKSGQVAVPPTPSGMRPCAAAPGPGRFTANAISMSQLAGDLSRSVERVVIDRTGLSGNFDVELTWTPDPKTSPTEAPQPDANSLSLFTAVQEQLGLKLESTHTSVDLLIVDRAERPAPD